VVSQHELEDREGAVPSGLLARADEVIE